MRRHSKYPEWKRDLAIKLLGFGFSASDVSCCLDIPASTLRTWIHRPSKAATRKVVLAPVVFALTHNEVTTSANGATTWVSLHTEMRKLTTD